MMALRGFRQGSRSMPTLTELEPGLWSQLEFGDCKPGDVRRTRRLVKYARQMAEKPDASTPRQTETWADCKAVYELFACPKATFAAITAPHYKRTLALQPGTYLVISDTTEVDYGYKCKRKGLGPLTAKHIDADFCYTRPWSLIRRRGKSWGWAHRNSGRGKKARRNEFIGSHVANVPQRRKSGAASLIASSPQSQAFDSFICVTAVLTTLMCSRISFRRATVG